MAEEISWHPPDAALRPASHFECTLRRRRKIGFCPRRHAGCALQCSDFRHRPAQPLYQATLKCHGRREGAPTTTACGPEPDRPASSFRSGAGVTPDGGWRGLQCGPDPKLALNEVARIAIDGQSVPELLPALPQMSFDI